MLSPVKLLYKPQISLEFQSGGGGGGGRKESGGEHNKTLSTTRIIWKNNKATIYTCHTSIMCNSGRVESRGSVCLCSASSPEKHFLYRVGKAALVYTINQANVITVSCSLLSPKKGYKQRLLMCLDPFNAYHNVSGSHLGLSDVILNLSNGKKRLRLDCMKFNEYN